MLIQTFVESAMAGYAESKLPRYASRGREVKDEEKLRATPHSSDEAA